MEGASPPQISGSGLVDHSAYWLHRLSSAVLVQFETRLAETGVTVAQWKVMVVLYRNDASTVFSIANFINIDAGSVTRTIDRLEAKGMVLRTPSVEDRRATEISLTDAGRMLLESELLPIADAQDDAWLEPLSLAELMVFKSLVAKLLLHQNIAAPDRWSRSGLCTDPR